MTRREFAFFLIGLGAGLLLAAAAIVQLVRLMMHHMFVMGLHWAPGSLLLSLPLLLISAGSILLITARFRPDSN